MDRRTFLRATGVLAAAGVVGGCAPTQANAIPDGDPSLALLQPSYELLTGDNRPYTFLLRTLDNAPIDADEVQVWVRTPDGEVLSGPYPAPGVQGRQSVFRAELDLAEPGPTMIVAVDDGRFGEAAVQVVDPADSAFPATGEAAVAVPTPTVADDLGVAELCTANPDCGMHETSLDAALGEGRPVMLLFATPAYCQTAVCGPAVQTVDAVRQRGEWGDTAWIHVEIYADAGQTLAEPVRAWNLPSEPWLYAIDQTGRIIERIDGPIPEYDVRAMASLLTTR